MSDGHSSETVLMVWAENFIRLHLNYNMPALVSGYYPAHKSNTCIRSKHPPPYETASNFKRGMFSHLNTS